MTDTGQIPGEGLPENGVGEAVQRPHTGLPGNGVPQQSGWGAQPQADAPSGFGGAAHDSAYTYLDLDHPAAPGTGLDDEDDVLLMPGPQGSWSDPQPVPPQPPIAMPAEGPAPVPAGGTGTGPLPGAAPVPATVSPASGSGPAEAAGSQPPSPPAPRRPLHLGPPLPETPTGGVSVRSLADRGPAVPASVPPASGPPTSGPEYLDVPADGSTAIPAQQTGEAGPAVPVPGSAWPVAPAASQQSLIPHADSVVPPHGGFPSVPSDAGPQSAPGEGAALNAAAAPNTAEADTPAPDGVPSPDEAASANPIAAAPEPAAADAPDPAAPDLGGAGAPDLVGAPDAAEAGAPAPVEAGVPNPADAGPPAPMRPDAPYPAATGAAAPAEGDASAPVESGVPNPAEAASPAPVEAGAGAPDPAGAVAPDTAGTAPANPAGAGAPALVEEGAPHPFGSDAPALVEEGAAQPLGSGGPTPVEAAVAARATPAAPVAAEPTPLPPPADGPRFATPGLQPDPADGPTEHAVPTDTPAADPPVPVVPQDGTPSAGTPVPAPGDPSPGRTVPAPDDAPADGPVPAGDTSAPSAVTVQPQAVAAEAPATTGTPPAGTPVGDPARWDPAAGTPPTGTPLPAQAPPPAPGGVPEAVLPAAEPAAAEADVPETAAAEAYEPAVRDAVHRVIRERRDIRNGFRPDPIPHDVLLRVLEAAHTAPSVGHSQPWDFVVIRSERTRERMHDLAMRQRDAYARTLPKGRARQFRELKIEAILDTPVNIVVTADPTRGGRHTLGRHTQPQMAPYSSALAVENLWLAARAEGLGVGWVSFFDERQMVAELGLPEHLEVVAYLCVGYVDEFPDEPELTQAGWSQRRPLSWVVHEEEYGNRALPGEDPHDLLDETLRGIRPLDAKALGEAWERQKRMTKPAGALGMLEIISAQLSGLSRICPPPIPEPAAVAIFAGDHGVHAQGVTSWPQEVTGQMVANFLGGGAVCNAFANQVGAEVCVIDVGVAAELPSTPGLLPRKVRPGTADFTAGPAMTREEALRAIEVGIETARDLVAAGNRALLTGEMGIANTTTSAALIAVYTGADPAEVTGRGTGINDEMHARKVDVVRRALDLHRPDPDDPIAVLVAIGGLEHAAMVGLLLGAAALRTPVILDGVSAGAAALVARAIAPEVLAACIAGHRSAEPGHVAALTTLGLRPLVDLDLRLGEGTGALLALPLVQSAARVMHEVATFDSAGVTEKS
ncbi:nicotinate-nucleotide--dimethylbenzimidazole phosphoribosyltransferase [Streptomyces sp.]|uniref:nicotinate-nucleotide--dimethylbenzimidazole phosphoribosyltransferase n=1 Tax=Streptomyces sp. TaxID=1931 RepID=UPI002F40CDA1